MPPPKGKNDWRSTGIIVGVVLAVIALIIGWQVIANQPPSETSLKAKAIQACRDDVRSQLKAPDSADFTGEQAEKASSTQWRVTGAVDADNSFGAHIRTRFECLSSVDKTGEYVSASATLEQAS